MDDTTHADPDLVVVAELPSFGPTRHDYARSVRAGSARRLRRGVYVDEGDWTALSRSQQYLRRLHAVARTRRNEPVFSHASAAVIHGLPLVNDDSGVVHMLAAEGRSGRSRNGVVEHELPHSGDVTRLEGLLATTVARTVIDIAATRNFLGAVAVADAAIHQPRYGSRAPLTTKGELQAVWERLLPFRGHMRARKALDFADARAESPLESASRVVMELLDLPRPSLQWAVTDASGFIGEVDFAWPEFGVVGEADGESKYLDATLRAGRSVEQVVLDEKHREDRIRILGYRVVRWGWREARVPELLRARLSAVGLTRGRSR